jgi:hypothetical protein
MKTPYFFSRKHLLIPFYIVLILAGLTTQTFALNSIFTTTEPQGNVAATQSITTFTVDVAGLDTDSLMLDGCTISFIDF